jgi:hypothetical protein
MILNGAFADYNNNKEHSAMGILYFDKIIRIFS